MATDGKRSKGRFLYLFDWNAKSKKKLFSNKSESAEGSNHGSENGDNLVISQYLLSELCENGDHSSFRGSGNYSCASSINGDDGYGTRAPGVVARLMGLDSMPTTSCEASSVSSYESRAVGGSYYHGAAAPFQSEHHNLEYGYAPNKVEGLPWSTMDSKRNKIYGRPIERFQTEILPPKSAKPISITHHKLLSPIKSPGFIPTKDAAYIMEAAARIIDPSPRPTNGIKIPSLGSPSSSFRLQDLKDKMDAAQRSSRLAESSKTPKRSTSAQQMGGNSSDRSSTRSLFKNITSSEASSSQKAKNKGKSVSMPARDKTNIQKKESAVHSENKSQKRKEHNQVKLKQKQPSSQKARQTRTSTSKTSSVLRQNNDKQNSASHKDKSISNSSVSDHQRIKICPGDSSSGPSKLVNKVLVNAENGSKKVVTATNVIDKSAILNGIDDKRPSLNRMKNISRNKQFASRDKRLAEDDVTDNTGERTGQCSQSCQNDSRMDMDVVSFTFTSPIKKAGTQSLSSTEASGSNRLRDVDTCDTNGQSHARSSLLSPSGLNLIDSGSLSLLLEQKLRELTDKVVANKSDLVKRGTDADSVSYFSESISSRDVVGSNYDEWSDKDQASTAYDDDCTSSLIAKSSQKREDFEGIEDHGICSVNKSEAGRKSDLGHLNISIPECSISESCMSSNATSSITCGYDQPSSPQSQEVTSCISTESVHRREDETDSTDVASYWELEYVRHVLHYAGLKRSGLDVDCKLIDPAVFDLLENLIITSGKNEELCSKTERKILFDGVAEIVRSRYERVCLGSHKEWAKWEMLLQNEWLIEDIYKEILCLQSMGNLMLDELVDRDMSTQYGRWLDFKIESLEEGMDIEKEIVASLVDELVADLFI